MHGTAQSDDSRPGAPATVNIPELIPVFPLSEVVLLPGEVLPLHIFEPRYRAMVQDALAGHRVIGIVEVDHGREPSELLPTPIRDVGCVGFIAEHQQLPDGRFLIWLLGIERFSIDEELAVETLYRQARVTYTPVEENAQALAGLAPVRSELRQVLPRLVDLDESARGKLQAQMGEVSDAQLIALASQILELSGPRKRELLEANNQVERFMMVYEDLYRHLDSIDELGGEPETLN
jgi:Lon protease-like protein